MKTGFTFDNAGAHVKDYGHCVTRSISIVTGKPFVEVYTELGELMKRTHRIFDMSGWAMHAAARKTNPSRGVPIELVHSYLAHMGYAWLPTMGIGTGCKVHMRRDELPAGRLILRLSKHVTAVIDGVEHSTYDSSRDGTRCVYGYWYKAD